MLIIQDCYDFDKKKREWSSNTVNTKLTNSDTVQCQPRLYCVNNQQTRMTSNLKNKTESMLNQYYLIFINNFLSMMTSNYLRIKTGELFGQNNK